MTTTCDSRPKILVADDQPAVLDSLRMLFGPAGFDLDTANGPDALIDAIQGDVYDLVLMDMNYSSDTTSGHEGLDVLSQIRALDTDLPIVVMTGWSTVELAVATMRARAADFVEKPWDNMALLGLVRREVEEGRKRRAEHQRQVRELEDARLTQQELLPSTLPVMPGWEIAAAWRPAEVVTGDYFDAIRFSETRIGIGIGDVIGKGLPAALLMSSIQAAVKSLTSTLTEPQCLCEKINRILCGSTAEGKFISFFYGVLDAEGRTLTYTNAGHNAPFVIRRKGPIERLSEGGVPLGLFLESRYKQATVGLAPGDRVVLFTDGITEAANPSNDEFGEEGLISACAGCTTLTASQVKDTIIDAVTRSCGGDFRDDATLIVIAAT